MRATRTIVLFLVLAIAPVSAPHEEDPVPRFLPTDDELRPLGLFVNVTAVRAGYDPTPKKLTPEGNIPREEFDKHLRQEVATLETVDLYGPGFVGHTYRGQVEVVITLVGPPSAEAWPYLWHRPPREDYSPSQGIGDEAFRLGALNETYILDFRRGPAMAHLVTYVKHDAENVSKLAKLIDEKLKRAVWSPAPGGPAKPASTPRQPGFGLLLAAAALGGSALLLRRFVAK